MYASKKHVHRYMKINKNLVIECDKWRRPYVRLRCRHVACTRTSQAQTLLGTYNCYTQGGSRLRGACIRSLARPLWIARRSLVARHRGVASDGVVRQQRGIVCITLRDKDRRHSLHRERGWRVRERGRGREKKRGFYLKGGASLLEYMNA